MGECFENGLQLKNILQILLHGGVHVTLINRISHLNYNLGPISYLCQCWKLLQLNFLVCQTKFVINRLVSGLYLLGDGNALEPDIN